LNFVGQGFLIFLEVLQVQGLDFSYRAQGQSMRATMRFPRRRFEFFFVRALLHVWRKPEAGCF